eukprot:gene11072-14816_t
MAITVLLALWIGQAVMAPRVMSELSRAWFPSPTRLAFNQALGAELKTVSDQVWQKNFGTTERWGRDVPLSKWGIALRLDDQASYPAYDRHYGRLWDTWERQQQVQEWSGLVLPILAIRSFSMGMAGTDFAHHRSFTTAAELHRRRIQDLMSEDLVAHADPMGDRHFAYQAAPDLWATVPPFDYHPPHAGWALAHQARSLAVLCAGLLLAAGNAIAGAWTAPRPGAILLGAAGVKAGEVGLRGDLHAVFLVAGDGAVAEAEGEGGVGVVVGAFDGEAGFA